MKKSAHNEGLLGVSGNKLSQEHDLQGVSEPELDDTEQVCNELDSCLEKIGDGSISVSDNEECMNQCCTEGGNAYQPKGNEAFSLFTKKDL